MEKRENYSEAARWWERHVDIPLPIIMATGSRILCPCKTQAPSILHFSLFYV